MTPIRKILLIIVEGTTDERSIALALKRSYKKDNLRFYVYHSDMTTELGYGIADVEAEIRNCVRRFLSENPYFQPDDISAVIQITDTDGAFIPNTCVEQGDNGCTTYELDRIVAGTRQSILNRNEQKSSILSSLSRKKTITYAHNAEDCGKSARYVYRIYYMSCNLEHVLHDKLNLSKEEKVECSERFERMCNRDPSCFESIILHPAIMNSTSYEESWAFIARGTNSLKRKSNFGYFIQEYFK